MDWFKDLTEAEKEEFIKANMHGILSFAGDKPYAIPAGYYYRKGTLLLVLAMPGRKADYLQKSHTVCFTICKPIWQTPDFEVPCTSVIVEGMLEEVTDASYYGMREPRQGSSSILFRIEPKKVGAKQCIHTPCECLAP